MIKPDGTNASLALGDAFGVVLANRLERAIRHQRSQRNRAVSRRRNGGRAFYSLNSNYEGCPILRSGAVRSAARIRTLAKFRIPLRLQTGCNARHLRVVTFRNSRLNCLAANANFPRRRCFANCALFRACVPVSAAFDSSKFGGMHEEPIVENIVPRTVGRQQNARGIELQLEQHGEALLIDVMANVGDDVRRPTRDNDRRNLRCEFSSARPSNRKRRRTPVR